MERLPIRMLVLTTTDAPGEPRSLGRDFPESRGLQEP